MGDDFGAVDEDVPFDWGGAHRLIGQFRSTATAIDDTRGSRQSAGEHALVDWKGPHADEFRSRQEKADADASEVATALRRSAYLMGDLRDAAEEEQRRRVQAREYRNAMEQNERHKPEIEIGDLRITGGLQVSVSSYSYAPKPPPSAKPPSLVSPAPSVGGR